MPRGLGHRKRRWVGCLLTAWVVCTASVLRAQTPGDANCDSQVDGLDAAALIDALFADPPSGCAGADVDADGQISAADLTTLMPLLAPPVAPVAPGPSITFFGIASPDGLPATPLGMINGLPVFFRGSGSGFLLVIEGKSGVSGLPPGLTTFDPDALDAAHRPDVQVESNRPLGDGSQTVCDGGVPAFDPPDFGPTLSVAHALNDLGCHFEPASGGSPCTVDTFGRPRFVGVGAQAQFCLPVPRSLVFAAGDTMLSVRLRDGAGNLGSLQQMILRVDPGGPPSTFTASPTAAATATRSPSATPTHTPLSTPTPTATFFTPSPTRPPPSVTPTSTGTRTPSTTPRPTTPGSATSSPTSTATRTSPPMTATPSPSQTPRQSIPPSSTPAGSATRTPSATATRTVTPTFSATTLPSATRSATRTPSATLATATPTRTPSATLATTTPTHTPTFTRTRTPTPTLAAATATRTTTFTPTRTPSSLATATATPTMSRTPTPTRTRTPSPKASPTPSPTQTGLLGPTITFFGVTRADDTLVDSAGITPGGVPIFLRPTGVGFSLVIEGRPGVSRASVGRFAYDTTIMDLPDLQVEVARPLGNGSADVCDMLPPMLGGVPATNPPNFDSTQTNFNTVNDLGCRFLDGGGSPLGRGGTDSCVLFDSGETHFVVQGPTGSTLQFCGFMDVPLHFPPGDTVVTARLRDVLGNVGPQAQIVIRAAP